MTDSSQKTSGAWPAVLFLFIAATVVPEVLIGSTPLSRIFTLLPQLPLYGSAALVIRELVIRFRLGRAGLLVLGLAFGVTIEGLALQSLFNPHFLNLDIAFGRAAEVNWPWTLYMVGYHALWSILIPITLAELLFPRRATQPWLGRFGLGAFIVLVVVMVVAFRGIFLKMSGFAAPLLPYASAAVAIVLLVALGLKIKRRKPAAEAIPPPPHLPGILTALFGLLWLGLYGDIFHHPHLTSVTANLAAGLVLAVAFIAACGRLSQATWSPLHWFSFVTGGLAANSLFGFVVVSASGSKLDLYGQVGIVLLVAAGLTALARSLKPPVVSSP